MISIYERMLEGSSPYLQQEHLFAFLSNESQEKAFFCSK
jgi:hypothetical protein